MDSNSLKLKIFVFLIFVVNVCGFSAPRGSYNKKVIAAMSNRNYAELETLARGFERKLDPEIAYFAGLHFEENKNEDLAKRFYDFGWKKAEPYMAKMCAQRRIGLSVKVTPMSVIEKFNRNYPGDMAGKIALANNAYETKNYKKVIQTVGLPSLNEFSKPPVMLRTDNFKRQRQITEQLEGENRMAFLRIFSLFHLKDKRFISYLRTWVSNWEISQHHTEFFKQWQEQEDLFSVEKHYGEDLLQAMYILQMRLSVKNREYTKAVGFAEKIYTASRLLPPPTLSDYCRGYFFSYTEDKELKKILASNIKISKDPYCLFFSNFYSGRLAVREKKYDTAMDFFRVAMDFAPTGDNYDNALWYYFDTALRFSFDHVLAALYSYGKRINDKEYFEDFFTSLSLSLLNKKQWNSYVKVFNTIAELPLGEIISQYAYVSARLLEEDYAKNPTPAVSLRKVIENAYLTAYNSAKGGQYYRVLAAKKLAMPIESVIGSKNSRSSVPDEGDKDFENLLEGYAKYGFEKRVFSEFIKDYYSVSLKSATKLSKLLYQKGSGDSLLYAHSLRILSYASGREGVMISKDVLMGLYPRPFLKEVQEMAKKYNISEYILFGLVRTESFFQSNVHSHAGAIGLSQLMPSTAKDVARALKLTNYNLYNPRTNLNFGAYYLGELIRRLDGSQLLALFSYNGGITRVRGWVKQNPHMPLDLLLEVVPILETRDYGRKVLSASVIYGYLYYGVNYNKIVDEIMSKR